MSQFAENTDGFEVDSNDAPVEAAPAVVAQAAPADDVDVDAPAGRQPNGRYARADAAPEPEPEFEDDEPEPVAAAPEKPKKARNDPEARIGKAVAAQREAERRAEAAERRAEELAARAPREPERPQPSARERYMALPGAPKEDDYASYADFTADMALFIADQRFAERDRASQRTAAEHRANQAREQINGTFASQIDAATKAEPEFLAGLSDEILNLPTFDDPDLARGARPTAWHVIGEEIRRSEVAPQLMRHLSDHPDELQRLATLPPRELTRAMAILESRLDAAPSGSAPLRAVSNARPPIRPERGTAPRHDDEGSEDESVDAHIRRENARELARRRAR